MLSSALRVGFNRVSIAARRRLLPTINAGNFFSMILCHTCALRRLVHVELVRYCSALK